MSENLRYANGGFCYHDSTAYCKEYGWNYKWKNIKNICPNGWHIPSEKDVNTLLSQRYFNWYGISDAYKINFNRSYTRREYLQDGVLVINWDWDYEHGFWTSESFNNEGIEGMYFGSVFAGGSWGITSEYKERNVALPVRCVYDEVIDD